MGVSELTSTEHLCVMVKHPFNFIAERCFDLLFQRRKLRLTGKNAICQFG
jgi:hypothetical protein